ncbi:hypothetical protein C8Q75DRAFT_730109 [Abortiporus biennis]|nr:hypothetical protein C8Q75DRAFT_730109 [Abortiporus biennis]
MLLCRIATYSPKLSDLVPSLPFSGLVGTHIILGCINAVLHGFTVELLQVPKLETAVALSRRLELQAAPEIKIKYKSLSPKHSNTLRPLTAGNGIQGSTSTSKSLSQESRSGIILLTRPRTKDAVVNIVPIEWDIWIQTLKLMIVYRLMEAHQHVLQRRENKL